MSLTNITNMISPKSENHVFISVQSIQGLLTAAPENISSDNQEKPAEPKRSCPICFDDSPSEGLIKPLDCDHIFCHVCLVEYLKVKISSFKVLNIPCPSSGCSQSFSEKTIKGILDEETFKSYQDIAIKKITANQEAKLCPKPGCTNLFRPSSKLAYTICVCQTKICNTCCNIWHEKKTCLEALDPEFQLYAKEQDIKFCMMCKTQVQKVEGCKHITCPICDYEWCWDCGREYDKKHQGVCTRTWSPLPPKLSALTKLKLKWRNSTKLIKIVLLITGVIVLPLLLCGILVLWPLWVYFKPSTDLSKERPIKSVCIIVFCILLGTLLAPLMIGLGIIIIFIQLTLAPFASYWEVNTDNIEPGNATRPKKQKRWLQRKIENFTYTPNARPGEAETDPGLQNVQHQVSIMGINFPVRNNLNYMAQIAQIESSNRQAQMNNVVFPIELQIY